MTGPHPKKEYTAVDIERYHNGSMTAEEAHALERAALDDPFLSDAIDGYVHTATPAADVASLKQQLQSRSGKVVAITKKKQPAWLRVAAMVVLLAGFGWMVYKLSGKTVLSGEMEQDMAVRTEAAPQQPAEQSIQQGPAADSITADREEKVATARVQNNSAEEPVVKNKAAATSAAPELAEQEFANDRAIVADTKAASAREALAPISTEGDAAAKRAPIYTFEARVTDTAGSPVPFATISVPHTNKITQADAVGIFSITAPDSSLTIAVNAAGFDSQQVMLNQSDSNATIALSRGERQLQEVVVTAKSNRASDSKQIRSKAEDGNNVLLEAVTPLAGWKRFNAYVAENLNLAEGKAGTLENSEAVLSFDVDGRGNAINIKVEKSVCPSCDSTAVRIIQQGSKWKKAEKASRAKAYIRF